MWVEGCDEGHPDCRQTDFWVTPRLKSLTTWNGDISEPAGDSGCQAKGVAQPVGCLPGMPKVYGLILGAT